jgi:hypothetical protein
VSKPAGILITSVEDTGVGISGEDLMKLFKFFGQCSKTKDINRGGMGLGLTISKMIVRQLGGNVSVKSHPNVGSTFQFCIPIEQVAQGPVCGQEHLSNPPPTIMRIMPIIKEQDDELKESHDDNIIHSTLPRKKKINPNILFE